MFLSLRGVQSFVFGLSTIIMSLLCRRLATKRKIEHIPNMTVIGNAFTLYKTTQTKMFRGIRKKFMIVLLASSGMYWDLIFIMDGQNSPTHASKIQNPRSWKQPEKEIPPPFTLEGATNEAIIIGSNSEAAETRKTICM